MRQPKEQQGLLQNLDHRGGGANLRDGLDDSPFGIPADNSLG
jgi:hypothetical protein